MADPITLMIVMAAVAAAAMYLLKPKMGNDNPLDDSRTEPSVRGTLSSFLLGRLRIGPVVGYVGGRKITKEKSPGGGGGKGGGGSAPKTTIYNEVGMHILSIGRGKKLHGIYQAGKLITSGPVSRGSSPTTTVNLGKEGSFTIYWGLDSQPVNARLRNLTGLASSFPHVFYVVWDTKRLGTSAVWPQLEYDVEVEHPADISLPTNGEYLKGDEQSAFFATWVLNAGTYTVAYLAANGYISTVGSTTLSGFATSAESATAGHLRQGSVLFRESPEYFAEVVNVWYNASAPSGLKYIIFVTKALPATVGSNVPLKILLNEYSGVNPSSALYQMLFATYPHGLGWSTSLFNLTDFNTLAAFFKNTELSPCTILLRSGKSIKDGIGMLMQDFGMLFYYDKQTAQYRIKTVRSGGTPKTLTIHEYKTDDYANSLAYSVLGASRTVYSFKDSSRKFADSTILITDDGNARYSGDPNTTKIDLNTITDLTTASMVASRREQEASLNGTLALKVSCARFDLMPGDLVDIQNISGLHRVLEVKCSPDNAYLVVTFVLDTYSISNDYQIQQPTGRNPGGRIDPSEDLAVGLIEGNRLMIRDQNGCLAFRIRNSGYIVGASLYASDTGSSYTFVSDFFYCTGGTLTSTLPVTSVLLEDGPEISVLGPDITDVEDLAGSEELWRSGYQLAVIGTEICYLKGIDISTNKLTGLIRGRMGTRVQQHAAGTPVFIMTEDAVTLFDRSFMTAGADVFIKSLPFSSTVQIDPADVTPVSLTYRGGGYRPLPCANINTPEGSRAWVSGGNAVLSWSYKNAQDAGAAGMGLSGVATTPPVPEGTFRIEVYSGSTLKRTATASTPDYTYTQANMVADFGSEPASFIVKVVGVLNGLTSEEETATISRI
jgi:hypothetical protein